MTDISSDVGIIAKKNDFGKWVLHGNLKESIKQIIAKAVKNLFWTGVMSNIKKTT